jgi:hypothetical protein
MEKYLNLIFNKHLLYIIQEYCKEKYTFLDELKENTKPVYDKIQDYGNSHIIYHKINRYESWWYLSLYY